MAKYLVVAHQTAASPELIEKLREIDARDTEAEFRLLVPATPPTHLMTWVEGQSEQIAQRRASEATAAFRAAGLLLTDTVIGDANPLKAIEAELRRPGSEYAMTIIGMLPPGLSRWLGRDLPHRVQAKLQMPVEIIFAGDAASERPAQIQAETGEEVNDAEPLTLRQLAQRQGQLLQCIDGDIGKVQEVLYDYVTGWPLWIGVRAHAYSVRPYLIPARAVQASAAGLWTRLSRKQILEQPAITIGEGFCSLSEEEAICRYFGLPFDEVKDTRVLRLHQELPGEERNEQHILASEMSDEAQSGVARRA